MNREETNHGMEPVGPTEPGTVPPAELHITRELVLRAQDGDPRSLSLLLERYRPRLARWASGRLPRYARSLVDTSDLVHDTLMAAVERLRHIEASAPGSFEAYVRRAVLNRIRDHIRTAKRRVTTDVDQAGLADDSPSPLDQAIGSDLLERYETSLERLTEEERRLIHLRVELRFEYSEIAAIMEKPSPDAARMAAKRAFRKLAELMGDR